MRDWERKAAASFIAFVAVCVYAWHKSAPFDQFANALEWILGIYVTGHAAQQVGLSATGKSDFAIKAAPAAPAPPIKVP